MTGRARMHDVMASLLAATESGRITWTPGGRADTYEWTGDAARVCLLTVPNEADVLAEAVRLAELRREDAAQHRADHGPDAVDEPDAELGPGVALAIEAAAAEEVAEVAPDLDTPEAGAARVAALERARRRDELAAAEERGRVDAEARAHRRALRRMRVVPHSVRVLTPDGQVVEELRLAPAGTARTAGTAETSGASAGTDELARRLFAAVRACVPSPDEVFEDLVDELRPPHPDGSGFRLPTRSAEPRSAAETVMGRV